MIENLTEVFHFLIDLKFNNNRKWFQENKERYQQAKSTFDSFIDELIVELKKMDPAIDVESAKDCVFRIYRDVRFSKNKEPYKNNFGAFISKGGRKSPYAGYYLHFEPDASFLGGGIYIPPSPVLKTIRESIYKNPQSFKAIIEAPEFKKTFGGIYGETLKRAPRGFPNDFEHIDLLKHKHYAVTHAVDNEFWEQKDVLFSIMEVYQVQKELNDYLNALIKT